MAVIIQSAGALETFASFVMRSAARRLRVRTDENYSRAPASEFVCVYVCAASRILK